MYRQIVDAVSPKALYILTTKSAAVINFIRNENHLVDVSISLSRLNLVLVVGHTEQRFSPSQKFLNLQGKNRKERRNKNMASKRNVKKASRSSIWKFQNASRIGSHTHIADQQVSIAVQNESSRSS